MRYLKIEEVATVIGVSCQTLNRWYKHKKDNPDNEVFKKLPAYEMHKVSGSRNIRLWSEENVWKLIDFKTNITKGRCGVMGKFKGRGTANVKND